MYTFAAAVLGLEEGGISALVFLAIVVAALTVFLVVRVVPVNRRRRAQGLPPIRWSAIGGSGLSKGALTSNDADWELTREKELRRQMDWEREQAGFEMLRHGRQVDRGYCARHDRHCRQPERPDHPPGGFDNPTVPDDWPPDLAAETRRPKKH